MVPCLFEPRPRLIQDVMLGSDRLEKSLETD